MVASKLRVGLIGHTSSGNALGRLYSNWLALHDVGIAARVLVPSPGTVWTPVAEDSEFVASFAPSAVDLARWATVLVAHKPWVGSLDIGLDLARRYEKPIVLDVDDPDFESEFDITPLTYLRRAARNPRRVLRDAGLVRLRKSVRMVDALTVSNPFLLELYGEAQVVPHARRFRPAGQPHSDKTQLHVAFVGTPTKHKGIQILRDAVQRVEGARLTITAPEPDGPRDCENWVGRTSLAEGLRIVDSADVICIPSSITVMSMGQLPVKLIDAMISGRAIVATDLPPIRWALSGSGILVKESTTGALASAFSRLRDPDLRSELGERARTRALNEFSTQAVGDRLSRILEEASIPHE